MMFKKTILAGLAAATLGLTALSTSTPADAAGYRFSGRSYGHPGGYGYRGGWGGYHHGWGGGGWGWGLGAGLAAGVLAAGALGAYDYYDSPGYGYGYGYGCPAIYDQWGNYLGRRCY